jgi:tRNA nucleotidyltransferase (CCA-adding enzyme)
MSSYSTKSKLHVRIRNFVAWIAPEKKTRETIKKQSDEIRGKIKKKAEDDGLTITDMPYSGSFAKKSGLRRHLQGETTNEGQDIDLAFVVKPDKETEFEPLIQRFKKYAEESYPDTKITATKSSVKMEFVGTKLTYDIVPMFATDDPEKQLLIRNNGDKIKHLSKNIPLLSATARKKQMTKTVWLFLMIA